MNITEITNKVNSLFSSINNAVLKSVPMIPAIFIFCTAMQRPGLSTLRSLANICSALEELGLDTGPNADGTPNMIVQVTHAIVNEVYRSLTEDAVVQASAAPGAVQTTSVGANAAGPVVSEGINKLYVKLVGLIQ